ncbi:MAG: hypothetical protein KGL50_12100 [Burkholderiales bacterium]|nr:hypothetical protein [Burkholderiales bacterium]
MPPPLHRPDPDSLRPARHRWPLRLLLAAVLGGCGGGSALDNAATIANPDTAGGQTLSFAYFQRCVNPVLKTAQTITVNGATTRNTCASGGCHDNATGTGGALRLVGSAADVSLADPPAQIRASDLYKNFYSSLGETVVGQPDQSRLLNKPLVRGVLHGGGQIFASPDDSGALLIRYWISRPLPQGQDEFGTAANSMFAGGDPVAGACLTQ